MRPKVLFILHLPPPVHGAAIVGQYIRDSRVIDERFECRYLNLTTAKDLTDIGGVGISKLLQYLKLLVSIYRAVKEFKPTLVYVTPNAKGGAFYKDFFVVQLLKVLGCSVVAHYHNKGVATRQHKFVDNILYRVFFKDLKVILLAEALYDDLKKYVSRNDVYICPNGIPQNIQHKSTDLSIKQSRFNILFLSNMMSQKGVWDLVEACAILRNRGVDFECHFVGEWSDIDELTFNTRIKSLILKNHIFVHGARYGAAKQIFFDRADLFVFPTFYHNEAFSLVLLEAMQSRLACIATREGAIPDIIDDGVTGSLIDKHNSEQLATQMEHFISNPELCASMGAKGYDKFITEFTLERFETRMRDILSACSNV